MNGRNTDARVVKDALIFIKVKKKVVRGVKVKSWSQ